VTAAVEQAVHRSRRTEKNSRYIFSFRYIFSLSDLPAEVDRQRLDMEPSSREEIQALHRDLMDQKRDVIERVKKLLEN
jgi:hypothetical protein